MAVKFDPKRHCGAPLPQVGPIKRQKFCTKLAESCPEHGHKPVGYYSHIRRNRLNEIIERARESGVDPSDVLGELELVRALLIAYVEDHTDLDDSESVAMTGELADRVIRAAQAFRKMRQEEMIHKMALVLLEQEMANSMMAEIEAIDPNLVAEWKQVLIEKIRERWGQISVPTSVRELKRITEGGGSEEGED